MGGQNFLIAAHCVILIPMTTWSWIFTIIALCGAYLNAYKNKLCWPIWCVSNCGFVVINLIRRQWPEVVLFCMFSATSIIGWKNHDKK